MEAEPRRRRAEPGARRPRVRQQRGDALRGDPPLPDGDQGAHDPADEVAEEPVGGDFEDPLVLGGVEERRAPDLADRALLPLVRRRLAEGGEVMFAGEEGGRPLHLAPVESPPHRPGEPGAERGRGLAGEQVVAVGLLPGVVLRVEVRRGGGGGVDADRAGKAVVQRGAERLRRDAGVRRVEVRDLLFRMDPGVGPPRRDDGDTGGTPARREVDPGERALDPPLDRVLPRLQLPAGETGPVVAEIESDSHSRRLRRRPPRRPPAGRRRPSRRAGRQ